MLHIPACKPMRPSSAIYALAGMMDSHGMPPNIIDPAGGGSSTRITLAHH
jgi:hypothetical protein